MNAVHIAPAKRRSLASNVLPLGEDAFVLMRPDARWHLFLEPYEPDRQPEYQEFSEHLRRLTPREARLPLTSLIVFVSEACNLRCDYCKVSAMINAPVKRRTDPAAIASSIIRAARAAPGPVDVTFYGGEPFLEFRAIGQICEEVTKATDGLVSFALTTNGTLLTDEIIQVLGENRICVGVSIDGSATGHDMHRRNVGGRATHSKVVENYGRLKRAGVECGPICVVTEPAKLGDIFDYFAENFDDRCVYLKPLEVCGDEDPVALETYFRTYAEAQLELLERCIADYNVGLPRRTENRTFGLLRGILRSHDRNVASCRTSGPRGCSVGREILGVEADGQTIPCPNVKKYRRTDPEWIAGIETRGGYCDGCAYKPLCPSFCMAEMNEDFIGAFLAGGDSRPVDAICNFNRTLIEGVLSLYRRFPEALLRYEADMPGPSGRFA